MRGSDIAADASTARGARTRGGGVNDGIHTTRQRVITLTDQGAAFRIADLTQSRRSARDCRSRCFYRQIASILRCDARHHDFLLASASDLRQRVLAARAPLTITAIVMSDRIGCARWRGPAVPIPLRTDASVSSAPLQRRRGSLSIVLAHRLRGFHALLEMALRDERTRPRPDDRTDAGFRKKKPAVKDRLASSIARQMPSASR